MAEPPTLDTAIETRVVRLDEKDSGDHVDLVWKLSDVRAEIQSDAWYGFSVRGRSKMSAGNRSHRFDRRHCRSFASLSTGTS